MIYRETIFNFNISYLKKIMSIGDVHRMLHRQINYVFVSICTVVRLSPLCVPLNENSSLIPSFSKSEIARLGFGSHFFNMRCGQQKKKEKKKERRNHLLGATQLQWHNDPIAQNSTFPCCSASNEASEPCGSTLSPSKREIRAHIVDATRASLQRPE